MSSTTTDDATHENRKKKSGRNVLSSLMTVLLILGLTVMLEAGFLFVMFGMLPTIIAYYADTTEERFGAVTIACCNLSGVLPYVMTLHGASNSWGMLTQFLSDPMIWLHMYGMAAAGYVLIRICPTLYRVGMHVVNSSLAFQVQQQQENLVKEWGEGIRAENEQHTAKNALTTTR